MCPIQKHLLFHEKQYIISLRKMQSSKNVYGEDAILASEVLLKNAGNKVEIDRNRVAKAQEIATEKMKPLMGGLGNLGM